MKTAHLSLSFLVAALPLAAQTTTPTHPAHPATTATTAAHHTTAQASAAGGECLSIAAISPKIPALPAGLSCVKPLYTVVHLPQLHAEYISPLVSPALREALDEKPTRFSLGFVEVVKGTGSLALPGKYLSVKYTGWLPDGTKFDSSEDHPGKEAIDFPYGEHRVIQGWDTGFEGMHVGGKRRLFIPYQLAYGDAGKPPVIPAKTALIFDVELVAVNDAAPKHEPKPPADVKQTTPLPAGTPAPSAANVKPADAAKPADATKPAEAAEPKK